ncbi:hypothetical protein BDZ45DRAFT_598406, partial [Acephala macrosclerotiorum]
TVRDVNCGGKVFTRQEIINRKTQMAAGQRGKYPENYNNDETPSPLFGTDK